MLRNRPDGGRRTKEEFLQVLTKAVIDRPLAHDQIDQLADALYPLFKPVELDGRTVVVEIPLSGRVSDELMERYCSYIDLLKDMGAKSAIFIEKGARLESLSDRELERYGLRRI